METEGRERRRDGRMKTKQKDTHTHIQTKREMTFNGILLLLGCKLKGIPSLLLDEMGAKAPVKPVNKTTVGLRQIHRPTDDCRPLAFYNMHLYKLTISTAQRATPATRWDASQPTDFRFLLLRLNVEALWDVWLGGLKNVVSLAPLLSPPSPFCHTPSCCLSLFLLPPVDNCQLAERAHFRLPFNFRSRTRTENPWARIRFDLAGAPWVCISMCVCVCVWKCFGWRTFVYLPNLSCSHQARITTIRSKQNTIKPTTGKPIVVLFILPLQRLHLFWQGGYRCIILLFLVICQDIANKITTTDFILTDHLNMTTISGNKSFCMKISFGFENNWSYQCQSKIDVIFCPILYH